MKRAIYALILLSILVYSCQNDEDFLTITPLDTYSDAAVWQDPALISAYVNNMYGNIFAYPYCIAPFATFVDEAQFLNDWGASDFNKSNISPDGLAGFDLSWSMPQTKAFLWDKMFIVVQESNVFMQNIKDAPTEHSDVTNRSKGEVFFIRAMAYHYLTSLYGGVPITEEVYSLDTTNYYIPRNSYEECINYITSQLDSAANLLPLVNTSENIGRATKGAALALKSRVLLYAASDLHNTTSYAPGYSNPELIAYTDGNREERWQKAKDAAKAVIDLGIYSLVNPTPAAGDNITENIENYFLEESMTSEDILYQQFTADMVTKLSWDEYPPNLTWASGAYGGWGCPGPLGNFVDSYEMKDGSYFSWDNPEHAAKPYENRDARLAATVLYEGSSWMPRPSGNKAYDPFNEMQCGVVLDENGDLVIGGTDNRVGPTGGNNSNTNTAYYLKKFLDPTVVPSSSTGQSIPFRHFRYAEVLLNYAEACIELGQDGEAREYLNMIRTRAGQPNVTESGDDLRKRYRNERKVELSFENHRFYDVRRWLIGPEAYKPVTGIQIVYTVNSSDNVTSYRKEDGSYWGNPVYTPVVIEERSWKDYAYFFPIYRTEMNKNTKLVQSPGYN